MPSSFHLNLCLYQAVQAKHAFKTTHLHSHDKTHVSQVQSHLITVDAMQFYRVISQIHTQRFSRYHGTLSSLSDLTWSHTASNVRCYRGFFRVLFFPGSKCFQFTELLKCITCNWSAIIAEVFVISYSQISCISMGMGKIITCESQNNYKSVFGMNNN